MGIRSQQRDKRGSDWEEEEEERRKSRRGGVLGSRSASPSHATRDGREQLCHVATQQESRFASQLECDAVVWNVEAGSKRRDAFTAVDGTVDKAAFPLHLELCKTQVTQLKTRNREKPQIWLESFYARMRSFFRCTFTHTYTANKDRAFFLVDGAN